MPVTISGSTGLTGVAAIDNVSSTELGYVDGVTSAIQTQLNGKAASTAFGAWTPGVENSGGAASFSTKAGHYAKIDSLYICWFVLDVGTLTSNGTAYITGLPANIHSDVPNNSDCGMVGVNWIGGNANYGLKRISGQNSKLGIYSGGGAALNSFNYLGGFFMYKAA